MTTTMAAAEAKANVFRLRLALQALLVHFRSNGYIRDKTMELLDFRVVKQVQGATARQGEVRESIGRDRQIWADLHACFEAAVPSFERRSIPGPDPHQPEFDAPSGPLIASNYTSLIRDIERMNDLVGICKNVLASGDVAQDNAARARFDQALFKIINICVKVTARGYDGDAGADEEKWQTVVNDYKKLLINCLQFLNNLVAQNERRKLMLWVQLFDSVSDSVFETMANGEHMMPSREGEKKDAQQSVDGARTSPADHQNSAEAGLKRLEDLEKRLLHPTHDTKGQASTGLSTTYREAMTKTIEDAMKEGKKIAESDTTGAFFTGPFMVFIGKNALNVRHELTAHDDSAEAIDVARECERRWRALTDVDLSKWCDLYEKIAGQAGSLSAITAAKDGSVVALADRLQQLRTDFESFNGSLAHVGSGPSALTANHGGESLKDLASQLPFDRTMPPDVSSYLTIGAGDSFSPPLASEVDYRMAYSAEYGADILQRGKDDLMKRLEPFVDRTQQMPGALPPDPHLPEHTQTMQPPPARVGPPVLLPRSSEYLSEAESEEEDYGIPGDDGRGLLTDIPLILGPNEIEILPMLILSSIVPPPTSATPGYGTTTDETIAIRNMHTVRCHFLLAQDNGRNLLRELLIFVAAWDLREDELYFKFMVKIMEAILNNGLMPFSYHAFRESKDIISPAQAVVMKLLTNIFRLRQARFQQQNTRSSQHVEHMPHYPTRVDVHMVNFLLTEFRRHIVPQTCALIFLQGQIRANHASPEDFPLNLWDMERMYEGIYQYLEFFAILTECDAWKQMMADWDITCELVTLLKELDAAIPRSILARELSKLPNALKHHTASVAPPSQQQDAESVDQQQSQAVSVERPYDPVSPMGPNLPESTLSFTQPTAPVNASGNPTHEDEPSDFPWKNLKKLTVLVLSSLTWKSQRVQDQVRQHGGVEVVLNCTKHDDFNPYIREHAIMALRFLVEGNDKNKEVVRLLEAKAAETARSKGAVSAVSSGKGFRRSAAVNVHLPSSGDAVAIASAVHEVVPTSSGGNQNADQAHQLAQQKEANAASGTVSTGLFDLMKEVMREMPARVRGQASDRHKTELLRQLDKEFD